MDKLEPITLEINPDINVDNALSFLVDILDKTALWEKDPNVKVCCKFIGAKIIGQQTKIDNALNALNA